MRELDTRNKLNKRLYFVFAFIAIILMCSGLTITILRHELWIKLLVHAFFVMTVSTLALIYPSKEINLIRGIMLFSIQLYFYALFLLYPETTSTIALIYFAPALSIFLFDRKLFIAIVTFNIIFGTSLFIGLNFSPYQELYRSITLDVIGNIINFWICEMLICLIFAFMARRMDRIKQYYQRIQQVERLNTVGQLAASVAHEIRNPLMVVRGFLQLSAVRTLSSEQTQLLIDELDRAEIIIGNYLSLAKPQLHEFHRTHVALEIRAVTDLLYPFALLSKHTFQLQLEENLWVNMASIEMKQVLTNIIKNAIEAIEMNGIITVLSYQTKDQAVIEVTDTGIGMTIQEVKKLGVPFYSLKQKGTGIGLTVCFDIVEKYKGHLQITSKPSVGTTVRISLPLVEMKNLL
jgi:two-component system sporulation sensor kinase B